MKYINRPELLLYVGNQRGDTFRISGIDVRNLGAVTLAFSDR